MTDNSLCHTNQSESNVQSAQQESHPPVKRGPVFQPRVDLIDSADAVTLWADLPGVDENSLDITVEHNTLMLKAQVQSPAFDGMEPLLKEYAIGDYERTFTISDEIDRDQIDAVVTQGVLKLTLPKTKHAALRKVNVKAG